MEWKNKVSRDCADELEGMIIDYVMAGFLSDREILEECADYVADFYPEDEESLSDEEYLKIIADLRSEYGNKGSEENFEKLDLAFKNLEKRGVTAMHYAGYIQDDGFADCNEVSAEKHARGERVIGCCFYTEQDLGHILHGDSDLLYLSFGNHFDSPTAREVGRVIKEELEKAGFSVKWEGDPDTKIAIENMKWDKHYNN